MAAVAVGQCVPSSTCDRQRRAFRAAESSSRCDRPPADPRVVSTEANTALAVPGARLHGGLHSGWGLGERGRGGAGNVPAPSRRPSSARRRSARTRASRASSTLCPWRAQTGPAKAWAAVAYVQKMPTMGSLARSRGYGYVVQLRIIRRAVYYAELVAAHSAAPCRVSYCYVESCKLHGACMLLVTRRSSASIEFSCSLSSTTIDCSPSLESCLWYTTSSIVPRERGSSVGGHRFGR